MSTFRVRSIRRGAVLLALALLPAAAGAAPSTTPKPAPGPLVTAAGEANPSAAGRDEGREVAEQVVAFGDALRSGQQPEALAQLERLREALPPRSLTLLRLEAWYAHASGDSARAISLYRDIVARLPGDATAAINLAILEAGNGQGESARRRLRRLRALDTDSQQLERAISQVEAQLR